MAVAEEHKNKKDPFSPLQTGCAFVMLTNMIIYLAVVAFVFNMLDPSKLKSSYLTQRGFVVREEESEEDKEFRNLTQKKKREQQKFQQQQQTDAALGSEQFPSPALELSRRSDQPRITDEILQKGTPHAALTPSRPKGYGGAKTAKSRQHLISTYPQATVRRSYSTLSTQEGRTIPPQHYDTVSIELAPGIEYPMFRIPPVRSAGESIYSPPNPVPNPVPDGPRVRVPALSPDAVQTNRTEKVEEPRKPTP